MRTVQRFISRIFVNESSSDIVRLLDCSPSGYSDKDFEFEAGEYTPAVDSGDVATVGSTQFKYGAILDQGDTGGCVGYAIAKAISLQRKKHMVELDPLSIWMAAKETDEFRAGPTTFVAGEGTSIKAGLDVVRKYGALPFGTLDQGMFNGTYNQYIKAALIGRIKMYERITSLNMSIIDNALLRGPLVCRLRVDSSFMSGRSDLIKRATDLGPNAMHGLHAVVIAERRIVNGTSRYVCVNSWGTGWGDNGTCLMSAQYFSASIDECWSMVL